jgi:hypothetical protein
MVYVGQARLPQPLVAATPSVAVELEVEPCSRRILAAHTNLQFPGLERILREILVDRPVDTTDGAAVLELEVRYSAPFTTAVGVAVRAALRRAVDGVACRDGRHLDGQRSSLSLRSRQVREEREPAEPFLRTSRDA